MSTTELSACETMWFKLGISLHRPVVHRMLIKNDKRTMMSDAFLQSYWNVKFMKNVYVSFCQHFFETLSCNNTVKKHQITMVLGQYLIDVGIQCTICSFFEMQK